MEFVGDTLVLRLGMQASGQGHATVFRDLLAHRLGIAPDAIVVEQGSSELPIRGGPAVGSRSTNAAGAAVVARAKKLIATARAEAATMLDAPVESVRYEDGYCEVAGTNRRISLFGLAAQLGNAGAGARLTTVVQADATNTYPNGCHIAEVEIDPDTGVVVLVGYAAVDDCGVVLDHTLAEAQIVGGLAQGFGQALMEHVVYDEEGQLLSGSLTDYAMPRATDMPPVTSAFHEVPCRTNELGVKGIGEAGPTASIAAVMNAISDAIPGIHIDMPATPEKVWQACQSVGSP
jgi:carbon-monoxide dehydrogenase large subunit